jgi:hypothetical protein
MIDKLIDRDRVIFDSPLPHAALALGYKQRSEKITLQRIDSAIHVVAKLIAEGGHEYIPIFERLEEEKEKMIEMEALVRRAKALSQTTNS